LAGSWNVFLKKLTLGEWSVSNEDHQLGGRRTGRYGMAAIVPVLVMVGILALVFYLARRSAYKKKQ
jgi:hypothetical protein